ncbi:MAG: hypothetical protein OQK12_15810, partial [Motiliproteus sp.]|nr:hypothetical protein [Motiliproteus sp.]
SFIAFFMLYLMTLPAAFTGGRVSLESLRFLDAKLITFSIVMAALIAPTLSMMIFLLGQHRRASSRAVAGGLTVGLLTPLLCCSPLLPTLMTVLAGISPALVGTYGWRVQWFIASYQDSLFVGAMLLLALALHQNAKRVVQADACPIRDNQATEKS